MIASYGGYEDRCPHCGGNWFVDYDNVLEGDVIKCFLCGRERDPHAPDLLLVGRKGGRGYGPRGPRTLKSKMRAEGRAKAPVYAPRTCVLCEVVFVPRSVNHSICDLSCPKSSGRRDFYRQ